MRASGPRRFTLCTGYKGELIEEAVRSRAWPPAVEVRCVDTGLDTPTSAPPTPTHGDLATMTVVLPRLQFGVADLNGDGRMRRFARRPARVNGGFFCLEPGVLARLHEDSVLERDLLEGLAPTGRLHAFRHEGLWDCMDTYTDAVCSTTSGRAAGALEDLARRLRLVCTPQ
jgi:glucose-1-phosphate cytidylyltransferase